MENIRQEILLAMLLILQERGLVSKDLYNGAREAVLRKTEWTEWFRDCGTLEKQNEKSGDHEK